MINIKQEAYFTNNFKFFGAILILVGGKFIFEDILYGLSLYFLLGIPLIVIGSILITAFHGLIIDTKNRTYQEYVWLLGFKTGKAVNFNRIEKIYINSVVRKGVAMNYLGNRYYTRQNAFNAYMKLDTGEKIFLLSNKKEGKLEKKVDQLIFKFGPLYQPDFSKN